MIFGGRRRGHRRRRLSARGSALGRQSSRRNVDRVALGVIRELSGAVMLFTSDTKVVSVLISDLNKSGDLGPSRCLAS
jgi:hypothetical protein